jgi:hypothetical protein
MATTRPVACPNAGSSQETRLYALNRSGVNVHEPATAPLQVQNTSENTSFVLIYMLIPTKMCQAPGLAQVDQHKTTYSHAGLLNDTTNTNQQGAKSNG